MKGQIEIEFSEPVREVAIAYTTAMHIAQRLEANLKVILKIADDHAWGAEIASHKQLKKFTNADEFIDKATCGALINALQRTGIIKRGPLVWSTFNKALNHRNLLAHNFLASQDFENPSMQAKTETTKRLNEMTRALRDAFNISAQMRRQLEAAAAEYIREFQ